MGSEPKKAILLDLDGTLVDSLEDICGHLNRVREDRYGLPRRPSGQLRPFIGRGVEHLIRMGCPELTEGEIPEVVRRFRASYLERPHAGGALYPGVRETLLRLRAMPFLRLAVVTNKLTAVAERTLAHYLPEVAFDRVAGPDTVSRPKPDAAHILEVLDRLGLTAPAAWMVGDHEVDRQCAEAAGVRFLGARYGFGGVTADGLQGLDSFTEILRKTGLS